MSLENDLITERVEKRNTLTNAMMKKINIKSQIEIGDNLIHFTLKIDLLIEMNGKRKDILEDINMKVDIIEEQTQNMDIIINHIENSQEGITTAEIENTDIILQRDIIITHLKRIIITAQLKVIKVKLKGVHLLIEIKDLITEL